MLHQCEVARHRGAACRTASSIGLRPYATKISNLTELATWLGAPETTLGKTVPKQWSRVLRAALS
jgi:hypothetical protein